MPLRGSLRPISGSGTLKSSARAQRRLSSCSPRKRKMSFVISHAMKPEATPNIAANSTSEG